MSDCCFRDPVLFWLAVARVVIRCCEVCHIVTLITSLDSCILFGRRLFRDPTGDCACLACEISTQTHSKDSH